MLCLRVCAVLLLLCVAFSSAQHNSGKWIRMLPFGPYFPTGRFFHSQAAAGNNALIFGGQNSLFYFNDLFLYSVQQNEIYLLDKGTGPSPRSGSCAALFPAITSFDTNTNVTTVLRNETFAVFGGYNGVKYLNDFWTFDLNAGVWTQVSSFGAPSARAYFSCGYNAEKFAVFGGQYGSSYLGVNDFYEYDLTTMAWKMVPNNSPLGVAPSGRAFAQGVHQGGDFFVYGGYDGKTCLQDTWAYVAASETWFNIPASSPPAPVAAYAGFVGSSGQYEIFGGVDSCTTTTNDLYSLSQKTPDWTQIPASGILPPPRAATVGTSHGSEVLVYAGANGQMVNGTFSVQAVYDDLWIWIRSN